MPCRNGFSIDYDRLSEVTEFLIEDGVHGIICAGAPVKYYAEIKQERFDLMHFIQKRIAGRFT
jgi:dihydrodipicolinate synthase/N-acetylneuraminate lyase